MQDEDKALSVVEQAAELTRCPDGKCESFPVPFIVEGEHVLLNTDYLMLTDAARYCFIRFAYTGDCTDAYVCEDYLDQQAEARANSKPTAEEWDAHVDAAIKLAVAAGVWVPGV